MITTVCTRPADQASGLRVLSGAEARDAHVRVEDHGLLWVDIVDPQDHDIAWLEQTFDFHKLALDDVARRHQRPKLDEFPDYYFGVMYAVRVESGRRRVSTSELQFFWGRTYLVTIHSEPFTEIEDLTNRGRTGALAPIVTSNTSDLEIPDLVYQLLDGVVDGYFPAVDAIAEWSEDVEEQMFSSSRGPETLQTIFRIRKNLIELRKVVAPSREVINVLLRRDRKLLADEFYPYFEDLYDHTVRVIDSLDTYRDVLSSALDIYLSIVSNDVNQTVKRMTALTAILMVTALIAGIYGMNFENIPELSWTYGYAWALGLMAGSALALWRLFKRLGWL